MAVIGYLALTPEQLRRENRLPGPIAWMSCRFAGDSLQDLPRALPPGSLLILEDSVLPENPDTGRITGALKACIRNLHCSGLLLDFQKPGVACLESLARDLSHALPCPVAVSEGYAGMTNGPVFLSQILPHQVPEDRLSPWQGRELWLELGPAAEEILVTETGTSLSPAAPEILPEAFEDPETLCRYRVTIEDGQARFRLYRSPQGLQALLSRTEPLGVTRYAALFQDRSFLP